MEGKEKENGKENPLSKMLKLFAKIIGATVIIAIVGSIIFAVKSETDLATSFSYAIFLSGVATMGIGALVGGGGSERAIVHSAAMHGTHHSNYYQKVANERSNRRDSQFVFMVLMALAGVIMIGMAGLITYLG